MLQFQDNDNTNQDIATTADNGVFFPQLNNVCMDWNINESEGFALQGTVIPQEKELNFGSLQCSCSSLPTTFSDPSWNMGYQFGGNQYTPSACCPLEQQTKKPVECAPPILSDIEPFLGKDIENKHIDYGVASAKQILSNTSNDCRLFSCMQPLNIPMYNAPFPTQDASLMQYNAINTNSYNLCMENDCFDPCSTSKSQYSSCVLEPNLDISCIRSENVERVSDSNPDLSSFISLDSGNDTILNVNDTDEESDIIVEDSDTESEVSIDVGPYMIDKEVTKEAVMRCFVCNLSYSEKLEFVQVNSSFPLTFISQTPVMLKLIEIIPIDMQTSVKFENSLICKRCLNLIDMTENLELRLVSVKKSLCDFVSRSSKDATDEDWSLIQGTNDICIEDNIVKNIEPLVSEKVKDDINISIAETEKMPTVETSGKNVNEYLSNDKKAPPEPVEAKQLCNTSDDDVGNNNVESISMTDNLSNFDKPTNKINVTDDLNGVLTEPIKKTDLNQSLPIKANNDTSNKINSKPKKVCYRLGGYQCDRCGKVFRCEKELINHLRKHAGEFIEKCLDCGKGFMKKNNLEVHMRKHRKHICIHCRASFDSNVQLEDHSKSCTENKVSCIECKLVFTSEIKLENHLKKHKFKSNICSVCDKSFKHPSYLVAHMKCHSDEKPFSCEKCGRNYKNQNHLRRHLKSHDMSLRCSKCQKVFSCLLELKKHLHIHEEEMECEICKKKVSKKYLSEHLKIHQNNKKRKECPVCKKMLTANIKVHMLTHAETKRYKCEICSVEFTFKHSLTKHIRLKHKS